MFDRRAILIGVDGYSFRPLASAVNDALAMRKALLGIDSGPAPIFADDDIRLLLTPSRDDVPGSVPATRQAILDALRPYYDNPEPADFLLVFFAGHGIVVSPDGRVRETLILPSDVPGPEEGRNMISVTELLSLFSERGPRNQLWIVDACRDMPYRRRPHGYAVDWPQQTPQSPRAQVVIFAVAQGGAALSEAGGQGRFTGHLIDGLAGKGAAADYVPGRGHCVTAPSLHEYVQRRVREALAGYDDWTRTIQMPQIAQSGPLVGPLRDLAAPQPRNFSVTVQPSAAEPAVKLALEVQVGLPVPGWPPVAPPRVYELRASLHPGMEQGWGPPMPQLRAVDLREEDRAVVEVPRAAAQPVGLQATTGERGIAHAETLTQKKSPFSIGILEVEPKATVTVRASDPAARVRMRRAEAPWNEIDADPNAPFDVAPGVWDLRVMIGDDVISATRVVLTDRERRTVQTIAQITPVTAVLLSGSTADGGSAAHGVHVSASIGPMQGAIVRTLLPLLALKLYDRERRLLLSLGHLDVPVLAPADIPDDEAPFVVALGVEGRDEPKRLPSVRGARLVWTGPASRVALFAGSIRDPQGTVTIQLGPERVNVAAPTVRGGVTVVAGASWPDGRLDLSLGVFRLPVDTPWTPNGPRIPVEGLARTLAVGVPLFRQGARFEDLEDPVSAAISNGEAVDPILASLTFHARDHRLSSEAGRLHEKYAEHLVNVRETIRGSLRTHFGDLQDSRVIAALHPNRDARRVALEELLQDSSLRQPALTVTLAHLARAALAARWNDHWAVERFDRVDLHQVFNIVRMSREEGFDDAAH